MVECSLKLVCLLIFILLCEKIGSEFGQLVSSKGEVPSLNSYYGRQYVGEQASSEDCDADGGLPCSEVDALKTFISSLGLPPAPSISRSFCSNKGYLTSISINCTCEWDVCHITGIIMPNLWLHGIIDPAVRDLTYLEILDLSSNKQIYGSIPDELGHLINLTKINLENNQLTGPIPKSLGNLTKLKILHLHMNFLSENIPPSLGNLASLVELQLQSNNLSGEIPHELGKLSELLYLRLDENQLCGELPRELGKLSKLQHMMIASNKLRGKLPEEFAQLGSLISFQLGGNDLSGLIPSFIAKWTNLTYLMTHSEDTPMVITIGPNIGKLDSGESAHIQKT